VVFWFSFDIKREQSALMKERSGPRGAQSHLTEKENLPRAQARKATFLPKNKKQKPPHRGPGTGVLFVNQTAIKRSC